MVMPQEKERRKSSRSAVQLSNFVTRLHKIGAPPVSIKLHPDGTLEAFFAASVPTGLDLELKMQQMAR
jgi:hypothetical protein